LQISKKKWLQTWLSNDEAGFSLLELILVIVLVAIISGFIANLLFYEVNLYTHLVDMSSSSQITRNTLQMLARDLRHIAAPDSIHLADADSIRFDDIDDITISYKLNSNKVYRNGDLLQEQINDLTFQYFDDSGNVISTPVSDTGEIRSIAVTLIVNINAQSVTFESNIQPRNF